MPKEIRLMKLSSLFILGLFFASCGTRKTKIDSYLANVETSQKKELKIDSIATVKELSKEKNVITFIDQKDIIQKDVTTQVKEIFKDGEVIERTTTTTISDKVDKSKNEAVSEIQKEASSIKKAIKHVKNTTNKAVDSLIKEKHKAVENKKGVGLWVTVTLILIVVFAIWYWWRKR